MSSSEKNQSDSNVFLNNFQTDFDPSNDNYRQETFFSVLILENVAWEIISAFELKNQSECQNPLWMHPYLSQTKNLKNRLRISTKKPKKRRKRTFKRVFNFNSFTGFNAHFIRFVFSLTGFTALKIFTR